jgi:putative membrane protein
MRYMHPGVGWFFWPHILGAGLLTVLWLGLLGLLIWGVVRLFSARPRAGTPVGTSWQPYGTPPAVGPSAVEILRQRYARGEIDDTTYQQMLERLQASTTPSEPYGSSSA